MKKRIIICGYPKSGNTWLTRLTAEVVGCPVVGFWCEPFNNEESIEGLERKSDYQCFKAHHSFEEMNHTLSCYGNGSEKIIYVIRDPRDVVVSASHYFYIQPRFKQLRRIMSVTTLGLNIYNKLFHTRKYKLDTLTEAIINGTTKMPWLHVPWKEHVSGYLNSDALIIKYEDLKEDALREVKRICEFLNIKRDDDSLTESIEIQSFESKKKKLLERNNIRNANFLRKGKSGEWKKELSNKNKELIHDEIGNVLEKLGYY